MQRDILCPLYLSSIPEVADQRKGEQLQNWCTGPHTLARHQRPRLRIWHTNSCVPPLQRLVAPFAHVQMGCATHPGQLPCSRMHKWAADTCPMLAALFAPTHMRKWGRSHQHEWGGGMHAHACTQPTGQEPRIHRLGTSVLLNCIQFLDSNSAVFLAYIIHYFIHYTSQN